jgi:hypothetical protein
MAGAPTKRVVYRYERGAGPLGSLHASVLCATEGEIDAGADYSFFNHFTQKKIVKKIVKKNVKKNIINLDLN